MNEIRNETSIHNALPSYYQFTEFLGYNYWNKDCTLNKVSLLLCAAVDRLNPNDLGWAFPAGLPSPQAGWAGAPPETTMHINAITLQI